MQEEKKKFSTMLSWDPLKKINFCRITLLHFSKKKKKRNEREENENKKFTDRLVSRTITVLEVVSLHITRESSSPWNYRQQRSIQRWLEFRMMMSSTGIILKVIRKRRNTDTVKVSKVFLTCLCIVYVQLRRRDRESPPRTTDLSSE